MSKKNCIIIDHRNANISSLKNAVKRVSDCTCEVSSDIKKIQSSDFLILPGVGAFGDSMKDLSDKNLVKVIQDQALKNKKPFLGICLGMQLLFDSSTEGGYNEGLSLIPGRVELMELEDSFRVPHVGWNDIIFSNNEKIFGSLEHDKNFYFVHSYHAVCDEKYVIAKVNYSENINAAVKNENILGFQFHPEKSQENGMNLLNDFFKQEYF